MSSTIDLSRRKFLGLAALTCTGAVLAACAPTAPAAEPTTAPAEVEAEAPTEAVEVEVPTSAPAAAPSGAKALRISAWADVQDAVVYEAILSSWHEKQGDFVATVEQYPGGYYEKILANFAAGDSADLLYFQGWIWQGYVESDVFAPLDDYIQKSGAQVMFPEGENYTNTTLWQGKTYMTPTDTGSLSMFYNKDLFDMKGIPYPQKGWTWEDYQDIVQKLSFTEDGTQYYGVAQAGGWNGGYGRCVNFMRRNGYTEWDRVIEPTKSLWDHEDIISALQFQVYDTIQNEWSPSPDVIAGGGVGVNTGRCAMVMEGPWYIPNLWGELATTQPGINFDVVEPPIGTSDRNYTFGHVHGHVMTAESEEKDGAWELIQYILGDEGQTIIANGGRMCGTPDNIDKIWGPIVSEAYNFENVSAFSNGMREGATPVIMGEGAQINAYGGGPITALWDALLGLQMTAEEAVAEYGPQIQAELDTYWADRA
ncbi:MAG: extracellular solute-binding protein [Anaerolineae bacterium]